MMKRKWILSAILWSTIAQWNVADAQIQIKDGETVAFMGNSITANGWQQGGYVRLIVSALENAGIKITPIPAGVGGNKSNDMLARLDKDVLSKNPDWMTLSCGVNDVWHGDRGVSLEDYQKNITAIIDRATANNVKVILLTSTVIGEDDNKNNRKLVDYNDFLRKLAKERKLPLADLAADFQQVLSKYETTSASRYLTVDGVHTNPEGNVLMAKGCLRAMGFTEAQIKKTENNWLNQPNTAKIMVYPYDPRPDVTLTLGEYRELEKVATKYNVTTVDFERSLWLRSLSEVIRDHDSEQVLNAEAIKKETNKRLKENIEKLIEK